MKRNTIGANPILANILKSVKTTEQEYKTTQLQPKKKKKKFIIHNERNHLTKQNKAAPQKKDFHWKKLEIVEDSINDKLKKENAKLKEKLLNLQLKTERYLEIIKMTKDLQSRALEIFNASFPPFEKTKSKEL
tara:strand:- start:767 stop:1165 length:399 start_codon:yes stop_codon:yes gene_type:complete